MPSQVGQPTRYYQKWAFNVEVQGVEVGRFSKAGPVKQTLAVTEQHEGGALFPVDVTPTKAKTEKFSLERGASDNAELWGWWNTLKSGEVERRDVHVYARDSQGNVARTWTLPNCLLVEFDAADFDAKNETDNVIEKVTLQTAEDISRT